MPKQEKQEIILATAGAKATNTMLGEETLNIDSDTMPQMDDPGESNKGDFPLDKTGVEKEDVPVIFKMLGKKILKLNGFSLGESTSHQSFSIVLLYNQ